MPIWQRHLLPLEFALLVFQGLTFAQGFDGAILIPPATYAVQDAPFTANVELVRTETLADQTHVKHRILSRVLRDSAGRQRFETGRDEAFYASQPSTDIRIYDVVARTIIHFNDVDLVATVVAMGATHTPPVRVPASKSISFQVDNRPPETSEKEKLPAQQIAGLTAEGIRTTYTIPAGREGNDKDMKVIDELWISPLYRMPLLHVHDDPRHGHTVVRVTEFTAGEPNAKLFRMPPGYEVHDKADPLY